MRGLTIPSYMNGMTPLFLFFVAIFENLDNRACGFFPLTFLTMKLTILTEQSTSPGSITTLCHTFSTPVVIHERKMLFFPQIFPPFQFHLMWGLMWWLPESTLPLIYIYIYISMIWWLHVICYMMWSSDVACHVSCQIRWHRNVGKTSGIHYSMWNPFLLLLLLLLSIQHLMLQSNFHPELPCSYTPI